MNTTPTTSYTDAQLQAAIDAAFPAGALANCGFGLDNFPNQSCWEDEAPNRLAIARAFLAALPQPEAMTATSDPYARLKAYAAAGARIRIDEDSWFTNEQYPWGFKALPEEYEVHPDDLHLCPEYAPKPWTLPAPPPGRRWHREDWKPEWLEGGYRPLLDGEAIAEHDEFQNELCAWIPAHMRFNEDKRRAANSSYLHLRTRRPLPAEASAEPEQAKTEKAGVNLEEALEKIEANLESWEEKADAMLDSERWHMKPRTEALVTELEEARAKIAEMEGKQAKPADESAQAGTKAQPWTPRPGDVVRLKSGGPEMTVRCLMPKDAAVCDWFDDGGCLDNKAFPAVCLTPTQPAA